MILSKFSSNSMPRLGEVQARVIRNLFLDSDDVFFQVMYLEITALQSRVVFTAVLMHLLERFIRIQNLAVVPPQSAES